MAQWFAAKEAHPDALVFFRMGDFYELFFSDAEAAAAALDIALTQRGEHNGTPIPMCGVPQHAAEAYLARLIRRGFRVAVTEQMEDPKSRTGKAPIRRDVVRLVTPGTITEEALLEAGRANLLLGLAQDRDGDRRRLARRVHRSVRDRGAGAGRPAQPARPAGAGGDPGAGGAAARRVGRQARARGRAVAAAGGAPAAGGDVRRRQRGRVRQLHRCRGDRGADGGGLCARHAGRHAAAPRSPGAAGPGRAAGDGRGDPRQPGDPPGARRRFAAHAVRHCAADADAGRCAAAGGMAGRAAHRSGGDRGTAGCVGVDGRGARCRRPAARRAADRAGYCASAWAAVGGTRRTAGPCGAARWAACGRGRRQLALQDTTPPPLAGGGCGEGDHPHASLPALLQVSSAARCTSIPRSNSR